MLDMPTRLKTETPPLADENLAPRPKLLTVADAKAMSLATMTDLFKDHINPGQLHFMKLLGFHKVKVERAEGMYYTDQNGRKILDFFGGFGSLAFGHNHPRILEARNQPALTFNHIKPAVNAIIGIVERGRTDPKAWGRTPSDQDAAEVATDGLRYVADVSRFNVKRRDALKDFLVWGYCAAVQEVDEDGDIIQDDEDDDVDDDDDDDWDDDEDEEEEDDIDDEDDDDDDDWDDDEDEDDEDDE